MATNNAINTGKPIEVSKGGTSATTFTANGVLLGNTTSAPTVTSAGTNGQVFLGATSAAPAFASLTSTAGSITYTTGAASLNLDLVNFVGVTSWTPTLKFGGGTTGITYTTQVGYYSRIANVVFFECEIVLSNKGSSTGAATITGLPVTAANINHPVRIRWTNLTYTGTPTGNVVNSTTIDLYDIPSASTNITLKDTDFANTTGLVISGNYFV